MAKNQFNVTEIRLHDVYKRVLLEYLPVICGFSIIGILGIFGNASTIVFFTKKLQSSTTFLLVSLAWFDLLVNISTFGVVAEMLIHVNVYHSSAVSCKLIYALVSWTLYASALTVWVMSIDRYRKICNPLKGQLSMKWAKIIVAIIVIVAAVLACRNFATHIITSIPIQAETNGSRTLTVFDCHELTEGDLYILVLSFHVLEGVCAIGICITIVVTYIMVVQSLYLHDKNFLTFDSQRHTSSLSKTKGQSQSKSDTRSSESKTEPGSSDCEVRLNEMGTISTVSKGSLNLMTLTREDKTITTLTTVTEHHKHIDEQNVSLTDISLQNTERRDNNNTISTDNAGKRYEPTPDNTVECTQTAKITGDRRATNAKRDDKLTKPNRGIRKSEKKATIMMLTVSVAFLLCYVPYICIRLVLKRWTIKSIEDFRADTWIPFLLPYINSVVNPVLYFMCNRTYRQYLKRLFSSCRRSS